MERFGRVLQRAERRLRAPEPERSCILMELAGDLEDMYRTYRERGLDEAEALRETEKWLAPSQTALESLGSVHLPAFDRLLDRLGGTARGRVELGFATLLSLATVGAGLFGVVRSGTVSVSSPGLWIVAVLVAFGLGTGVTRAYALFVRGDRLAPTWRPDLGRIVAAAVATALSGLLFGVLRLTLAVAPPEGPEAWATLWSTVATASGVAALGLCGALLLALLWLLLRVRAEAVRRARRELRQTVAPLNLDDVEQPILQRETRR